MIGPSQNENPRQQSAEYGARFHRVRRRLANRVPSLHPTAARRQGKPAKHCGPASTKETGPHTHLNLMNARMPPGPFPAVKPGTAPSQVLNPAVTAP